MNTKVGFLLLMEQIRRGVVEQAWVEAGYCIDAPELLAAGSHRRHVVGDNDDDWLSMPTTTTREPSNVEIAK